jgi:hypothetical protein
VEGAFAVLVRKHGLLADDGTPLRVSVSRLRKNKAQQLMKLSNGNVAMVATLLGNTVRVAGENYLSITPALEKDAAKFVGEDFERVLSGAASTSAAGVEPTPVGRCRDPLGGAFAPKDGMSHCEQFMHCLRCPSYAIAGTVGDLHRLFSFQRFLQAEGDYFPPTESFQAWRIQRQEMVNFIDTFTRHHFDSEVVLRARELALSAPHKFWSAQLRTLERLEARHG